MLNIQNESVLAPDVLKDLEHKTVDVGEHRLSYEMLNGGKQPKRTMILCHGAFCTRHSMKVLAGKLAESHPEDRILLIDIPWHGDSVSTMSIEGATVDTYASILKEFIEVLREDGTITGKLAWFGWSMGGSIGMLLDLKGAGIDELVLVNSAPIWATLEAAIQQAPAIAQPETTKDAFRFIVENDLQTGVTNKEYEDILSQYEALTPEPKVMVNDSIAISTANYDIRDRLSEIKAKTIIFSGLNDPLANPDMQMIMEKQIKNAVMHIGADNHMALLKQDEAKTIVRCFVDGIRLDG